MVQTVANGSTHALPYVPAWEGDALPTSCQYFAKVGGFVNRFFARQADGK